jgi:anti-anti-sigma regulatory factor
MDFPCNPLVNCILQADITNWWDPGRAPLESRCAAGFIQRILREVTGVGVTWSQADDTSLVRLEGVIDISMAAELKDALSRAVAACRPIRIVADGVTGLDVTAFQLLRAARRDAGQKGIGFSFAGRLSESMLGFLESAGLEIE